MKTKRCSVEPVARTSGRRPDTTIRRPRGSRTATTTSSGVASVPASRRPSTITAREEHRPTVNLRREFRIWRAALPSRLERDTMLTPLWVAESIVQEVERYLKADLPPHWARRLAAKAHYLYPRHKHFKRGLNRPGWRGLENLRMFMRHWTAGWLKRERYALYRQFPRSFAQGQPLPATG